ncbi:DNA-binding transcriptional MerR regulator [Thermocatellispora tengchongensis]|uniref:DNA-binding transcriptional MerR regulator n=1 Tax=Thermocatellispora tengchongensis TaxID=1073253 RepID=A0A840P4T5_9ACTN|nr:MerR family transcriptional regulator [Thermocatellispora tengchongensis]MBB5133526.1 DNA-binding transcriptional MerR regulator [Thermocatellispora tengchongensis]
MTPRSLRPVDLAREHGLSTQAVRNYEDEGILPPVERSGTGYRRYTAAHARALRAFLALRLGYGHRTAAEILRAANRGDEEALFRLIDQAHAELLRERRILDEVTAALGALTAAPEQQEGRRKELSIGALAHQLGMHPASLRKWENAGILRARRDPVTGHRRYPPDTVRDAHVVRQLRRGGYPLPRIKVFIDQLRAVGDTADLEGVLAEWRVRLRGRSRAMLAAGRHLDDYLHLAAPPEAPVDGRGAYS